MANEPKNGKKGGKLAIIFFALFLIEFVFLAFKMLQVTEPSQFKTDDGLTKFIDNIYYPASFSNPGKVLFYIIDANDQSGSALHEVPQTLYLNIPVSADEKDFTKFIKENVKVTGLKYYYTKGSEVANLPPSDEEIKNKVNDFGTNADNPGEVFVINPVINPEPDKNNGFSTLSVPIDWTIKQTGYYRLDIETKLNRAKYVNINGAQKIKVDNAYITPIGEDKPSEKALNDKWNKTCSTTIYLAVYDGTKPKEEKTKRTVDYKRVSFGR
jgi:hypothetical protein